MLNSNPRSTLLKPRHDPDVSTGHSWESGQTRDVDSYLVKEKVLLSSTTWKRDRLPVN